MREKPNNRATIRNMYILDRGWDGIDALPVQHDLIRLWEEIVRTIDSHYPDSFVWVAPTADGGIGLDADNEERELFIYMSDCDMMEIERNIGEVDLPIMDCKFSMPLIIEMLDWLEGKGE